MSRVLPVAILKKCSNASDPCDDTLTSAVTANGSFSAKKVITFLLALVLGLLALILSPLVFGIALLAKLLEY